MGNEWGHEAFKDYILEAAASVPGVSTQADIARVTGVSPSVLSKWFRGETVPTDANLRRVQHGFAEYGVTIKLRDLARLVGRVMDDDDPGSLAAPVAALGHPLAREVDQMLADNSPLDPADREALRTILDRLIQPYRRQMKRRRTA